MNQLELLSPAGDINIFKSVINAGADAVYFGGDLFGARAYAKNFSLEEAQEAIQYAHVHGAKAYLTVNTLLKNIEIEKKLYDYLKSYVESGIDAFIVQDFGVFDFIKTYFPDTHIHASTQMSLCTKDGASFIEKSGASRIVTAREISIPEIAKIHETCPDLEIESFIHGALCVCYSGQCLMSSIIGGRSGNRGRCAQPCRLPYKAHNLDGSYIKTNGDYILSPKDFCTIKSLPEMIEAGVVSFKIEGRMKSLSYATGVVSVYRKYIDQYLFKGKRGYSVQDSDIQKLLDCGNRSGFTDLYLKEHNGPDMITFMEPGHSKTINNQVDVEEKKIELDCKVVANLGKPLQVTFSDDKGNIGNAIGPVIEASKSRPATKEDIIKSVSQLGNTHFSIGKISVDYDDNIFLPVSILKQCRRDSIDEYFKKLGINSDKTINDFEELKFSGNKIRTDLNNINVYVNTKEQFYCCCKYDFIDSIIVPLNLLRHIGDYSQYGKKIVVALPDIIRDKYLKDIDIPKDTDGVLVCSYDGLGYLNNINYSKDQIMLDHRLYTFSNRALKAFQEAGYNSFTAPYELSIKEFSHRDNSNTQLIIYSRIPLMVTANCTIKNSVGCKKANSTYEIIDRKDEAFVVKCNCDYCYNTIYNSKKFTAFGLRDEINKLGFKQYRLDFTVESESETNKILSLYKKTFIDNETFDNSDGITKGHLKRGVE